MSNEVLLLIIGIALVLFALPNIRRSYRNGGVELLSTQAIAQTIAGQQKKIETLEDEVTQLQRQIIVMQGRIERADEKAKDMGLQLKNVIAERDALQRALRASGINISDSTVHMRDAVGGDESKRDETTNQIGKRNE